MTNTTIPDELLDLVTTNNLAHVTSIRADGGVATYPMWIDWDGEHIVTSSPIIASCVPVLPSLDENLEFIDKMSARYMGMPYRRRDFDREIFLITPDNIRVGHGAAARR